MGAGLQIWNAAGALVFDTADRASRIIGSFIVPVSGTGSSGSLALPTGMGDYWWFIMPSNGARYVCNVSLSGSTLSWQPSTLWSPQVECTVIYGVY